MYLYMPSFHASPTLSAIVYACMRQQVAHIRQIVDSPTHRLFRERDYYGRFDVETPSSRQLFTYLDLSTLSPSQ